MIEIGQHPADEVTLFGHTIHGLITGSINFPVVVVDEAEFPVPPSYAVPQPETVQIIRHPDVGPVGLDEETLAAERAQGRVWQNFALLKNGFFGEILFGQVVRGWIYIDSLGQRWLVQPGVLPNAVAGQPYSLDLECLPFGYLDGAPPMEPVTLTVTCADLMQLTAGERFVVLATANGTGSRCILQLTPTSPSAAMPSGFLEITISDDGGELAASLTVLHGQAAVRGTWTTTHPDTTDPADLFEYHYMVVGAVLEGAVYPEGPDAPYFPVGGGTATITVTNVVELPGEDQVADVYAKGSVAITSARSGRLLALVFDDADELIEITLDTRYDYEGAVPGWTTSAGGELTAYGDGVHINASPWTTVDEPFANVSRTMSESVETTVTLKRGGVTAYSFTNRVSYSATLTADLPQPTTGWAWAGGYIGHWISGFVFAERVDITGSSTPTAGLAEKGGPWPESWATSPSSANGSGSMSYLPSFPLGTTERDADVLQVSLSPVSYRPAAGKERVILLETRTTSGVYTEREMARAYPHAQLVGRDTAREEVAYHPIEHTLAVATDVSFSATFV